MSAYFEKVVQSSVADVQCAGSGQRNETLNKAAFAVGRHAHLKGANIDNALIELHSAAKMIGLQEHEIKSTVASGFRRGAENPHTIEDNDAPFMPSDLDRLIARLSAAGLMEADNEKREQKMAQAIKAWESAVPIRSDNRDAIRPALHYLNNRHLAARTGVDIARFSSNVYGGPAIVFSAQDDTGNVTGIQAVLLDENGNKREHNGISKYSRGVIAGSTMRINAANDAAPYIICEGPEDALSVRQAVGEDAHIICTFGKAGMQTFVPPRGADVTICADPDLDIDKTADALNHDGSIRVHVVSFHSIDAATKDANDYIREHGADKLREALAMAKPIEEKKAEAIREGLSGPTVYDFWDASKLEPRKWIYGKHYLRKFVSVLASAGGVGKTSMIIAEALSIASGKPLLGEAVHERCKVWIVNLEDPMEEMQRRVLAAMKFHDIKREDVEGYLFMDAGRDFQMKFATQTRDGVVPNDALIEYMIKRTTEEDIGLVIIDPWIGAIDINENDNSAMNTATAGVRQVADEAQCSIGVVHHIRKTNGEDATIDSVRGAGSLIGAARAARVVNKVAEDDAISIGVPPDQARGLFRVDDGKANLAPPASDAVYRRMVGVQIENGEWVGVCTAFKMPDLFDGITVRHTRAVQKAVSLAEKEQRAFRVSPQSKDWIGAEVARILDLDLEKPQEKARVKAILKKWLETKVLKKEDVPDPRSGRDVPCIIVDQWITAEEAGE